MKLKHYEAMWCSGHKFHIKMLYWKMKNSNIRIFEVLQVNNVSSRSDKHPEVSKIRYYYLQDIFDCEFKSFKTFFSTSNGKIYKWMNMFLKNLLFNVIMDLPCLIKWTLSFHVMLEAHMASSPQPCLTSLLISKYPICLL